MFQTNRIRIPADLGLLEDLKKEMLNFKFKIGPSTIMTFAGTQGTHDDIVMSLGVAIWLGEYHTKKKMKVFGG